MGVASAPVTNGPILSDSRSRVRQAPLLPAVRELAKASPTAVSTSRWWLSPPWESIHLRLEHEAASLVVGVIEVVSRDYPARIDATDNCAHRAWVKRSDIGVLSAQEAVAW